MGGSESGGSVDRSDAVCTKKAWFWNSKSEDLWYRVWWQHCQQRRSGYHKKLGFGIQNPRVCGTEAGGSIVSSDAVGTTKSLVLKFKIQGFVVPSLGAALSAATQWVPQKAWF